MTEIKLFNREILASYNIYEQIKNKYPHREVIPCAYVDFNEFYYFSKGHVRRVNILDDSIYTCDHEKGFPWMKRIR